MAIICGVDFETSGLDSKVHSITEVGLVQWSTQLHAPVKVMGFLVNPGLDAVWDGETEAINGITPDLCTKYGYESQRACKQVLLWYQEADFACAHNKDFDRGFLRVWAEKYGFDWQPDKLWIDTKADLEIPERDSTRLTYMAADHRFLNPFPHRAVFDVMTALKVLDCYDFNTVVEAAKTPKVLVQALVSYEERELAKNRGYHWQPDTKVWTRSLRVTRISQEEAEAGFRIKVLNV